MNEKGEMSREKLARANAQLRDKIAEFRKTNDDLLNFLASTDIATVSLDTDLRVRRFTPATVRVLNLRETDVGHRLSELSPRFEDPALEDDARRVLDELRPIQAEARNAEGRHYIRRITPFKTAEGEIEGVVISYSDVTRLKQASERLVFREGQQAVIAQLGRRALAGGDLGSLFKIAVEWVAETIGVEFAKLLRLEPGGQDFLLIAGVGWDEGLVGRATIPAGSESQGGFTIEQSAPVIVTDLREDRRLNRPKLLTDHGVVSGMSVVIGPESAPWGVLGAHTREPTEFTTDDTNFVLAIANILWEAIQRREKERLLREQLAVIDGIYDSAPIGLCLIDADLRFVRANESLAEMNGKSIDEHIGRSVRDVVPHLAESLEPLLERVLETGNAALNVEISGPAADDPTATRTWIGSYTPVVSGGKIIGINTSMVDITSRRRAEAELEQARRAAEVASEAKSRFLANMSHEIRSPLTTILGMAELLRPKVADPSDGALIERVKQNGDHLCQILDDILDLSRIESGKLRTKLERCDPVSLLAQIVSLTDVGASGGDLTLSLEFEGAMPTTIETDPRMLRQIVLNLVGNAMKFTEKGEVRVVSRCDTEDEMLVISVIDSGPGIHASKTEVIFEPFEQVDTSSTRSVGGTGLGLAISRRLVEELGGGIELESEVGVGSRFTVRVSTGSLADVEMIEPNGRTAAAVARAESGRTRLPSFSGRILAVEDRHDIRLLITEFLEAAGCKVVTATDGAEAVSLVAASDRFDAVLMDIQMPSMDGLEATRKLRQAGYRRPIIALTAGVMEPDRERALDAGCDDFVGKPIDREDLIRTLHRWLGGTEPPRSGRRILVVDDHDPMLEVQRLLLESDGHAVETATSGEEALAILDCFDPEIVILDLGLPGISGADLLARMKRRADLGECRFICISGREEDEVDWRGLGFDEFFQKPAEVGALRAAIDRAGQKSGAVG